MRGRRRAAAEHLQKEPEARNCSSPQDIPHPRNAAHNRSGRAQPETEPHPEPPAERRRAQHQGHTAQARQPSPPGPTHQGTPTAHATRTTHQNPPESPTHPPSTKHPATPPQAPKRPTRRLPKAAHLEAGQLYAAALANAPHNLRGDRTQEEPHPQLQCKDIPPLGPAATATRARAPGNPTTPPGDHRGRRGDPRKPPSEAPNQTPKKFWPSRKTTPTTTQKLPSKCSVIASHLPHKHKFRKQNLRKTRNKNFHRYSHAQIARQERRKGPTQRWHSTEATHGPCRTPGALRRPCSPAPACAVQTTNTATRHAGLTGRHSGSGERNRQHGTTTWGRRLARPTPSTHRYSSGKAQQHKASTSRNRARAAPSHWATLPSEQPPRR